MNLIENIVDEFPELESEMELAEGWEIFYKMERIAQMLNKLIKEKELIEVKKCFSIFEKHLTKGVSEKMLNTINVSFLEPIILTNSVENYNWALSNMETQLKALCLDYKKYWNDLVESSKQK
jgi:hypothetical protein